MPLPRWLARTNRRLTNQVLGRIPPRISPFAIVHHTGRSTGRAYATPFAAFAVPSGIILTPTYGLDADWVKNLLAAQSFEVDKGGTTTTMDNPRLIGRAEAWPHLPRFVRAAMRLLGINWFLRADLATTRRGPAVRWRC